jgi:hypothetical protein
MIEYKKILEELGYRLKDHGLYWRTNAVYRSGNNGSALQIYKDTGVWKDYVEDSLFLPFEALVEKTLGTKDGSVIKSYLNNNDPSETYKPASRKLLKEEKTYSQDSLSRLLPHYDFYLDKGISKSTIEEFKCGLAMSNKMYQRLVFPILREDGKIHGFSGRKVTEDEKPKWLHSGRCSDWFYPYHTTSGTKKAIEESNSVHIVESIGDCISLYDNGVKNVLVSFGLNVSPKFISRLSSLRVDKIFVSFNNDFNSEKNRGFEGAIKSVFKLIQSLDFKKIYFSPPSTNDFGDMTEKDIKTYMTHCKNMEHKSSSSDILSIATEMEAKGVNKSFTASLKKYKKTYDFNYGNI